MRLGGPVFGYDPSDPQQWMNSVKQEGYRAIVFPLLHDADSHLIESYKETARLEDILIAEVGAWSNPISTNDTERKKAIAYCQKQLELAERVGANCCVNIAGSRGEAWDGPDPTHYSKDIFALIVDTVREIIDAVNPEQTCYALETMPWISPDSVESYIQLVKAIDRKGFGVHFDPVNIITTPKLYYRNSEMIQDFVHHLGGHIRSCHAKDILLSPRFTVHLDEAIPGKGNLSYPVLLKALNHLNPDMPLILEHLNDQTEYQQAANFIRSEARKMDIPL